MTAPSEVMELTSGEVGVGIVPSIGGSVSHFRFDDTHLMRALNEADRTAGNVLGVAMFPMVPYANRIAGNAFDFDGKTYRFDTNNPPEKFHVHGTGWHRPWTIASQSEREALLTLEVLDPGAAYAYSASQRFAVDDQGLSVSMRITNAGPVAMPFGFGLHPWFDRDPDVTLQFAARQYYLEEPDGVSGDPISLPPELDFATARALPQRWRNSDYGGWDGIATIRYPARGVQLTMRAEPMFRHLMVYADPKSPVFCVEPQTNASGAFNRSGGLTDPDQGVIVLQPGASASGGIRFEVAPL